VAGLGGSEDTTAGDGPVHYLDRDYEDDEMVPVKLVNSLAKHLKINLEKFWQDADALASLEQMPLKLRQPN